MKLAQTLERIRTENGLRTDGELARFIGIDKRRMSDYLSEKREPTREDYPKIAAAAGISAGTLWEAVQVERATEENEKRAWENYMKRLGGFAASIALAFTILVTGIVTPSPAEAAPIRQVNLTCFVLCKVRRMVLQVQSILRRIGQKCTFGMFIGRIAQKPA